jgi:hypothetical protein
MGEHVGREGLRGMWRDRGLDCVTFERQIRRLEELSRKWTKHGTGDPTAGCTAERRSSIGP